MFLFHISFRQIIYFVFFYFNFGFVEFTSDRLEFSICICKRWYGLFAHSRHRVPEKFLTVCPDEFSWNEELYEYKKIPYGPAPDETVYLPSPLLMSDLINDLLLPVHGKVFSPCITTNSHCYHASWLLTIQLFFLLSSWLAQPLLPSHSIMFY